MDNKLSVSLDLDISDYEEQVNDALKIFAGFEKSLSDPKLKFNDFQTTELSKIFDEFRNKALKEISKVQDKLQALNKEKISLDFEYGQIDKVLDKLSEKIDITPQGSEEWHHLMDEWNKVYDTKLEPLQVKMDLNDQDIKDAEQRYQMLIGYLSSNPLEVDFYDTDFVKFNQEIDNVVKGLTKTGQEAKKAKNEISLMTMLKGKLSLFGRMLSQMKNSIAAALNPLNLFRKGWNEIIMSDTSRFGATFRNIGNNVMEYLAPAFEAIANLILRCLAYLNQFLKSISNGQWDLFKKSAKSAKSMQGSVAATQKMLAGFDEINDIGDKGGAGGGSGSGATANPFTEDEVWKNSEGVWDAVNKGISNARDGLRAYQEEQSDILNNTEAFSQAYGHWDMFVQGIGRSWQGLIDIVAGVWDIIEGLIGMFIAIISADWDSLGEYFNQFITGIWEVVKGAFETILGAWESLVGLIKGILGAVWDWMWNTIFVPIGKFFINLFDNIKSIFVAALDFIKGKVDSFIKAVKKGIVNVFDFIVSIPDKIWSGIKWLINGITGGINVLIRGLNKISFDVPDWVPLIGGQKWGFNIPEIPRLEVGTNYVPQDTLAMIHKGEAVIPKEFNSQEYFGTGNEEVVSKLDQLIEVLENKNMSVSISKEAIGQASVEYQRFENRRLGRRLV